MSCQVDVDVDVDIDFYSVVAFIGVYFGGGYEWLSVCFVGGMSGWDGMGWDGFFAGFWARAYYVTVMLL